MALVISSAVALATATISGVYYFWPSSVESQDDEKCADSPIPLLTDNTSSTNESIKSTNKPIKSQPNQLAGVFTEMKEFHKGAHKLKPCSPIKKKRNDLIFVIKERMEKIRPDLV